MNITLTPELSAAVAGYAKILGCSESEFLNRYLEIHLVSEPENNSIVGVRSTMDEFAEFMFKSREEAQRVLDWCWASLKRVASKDGDKIRIRTEIVETAPECPGESLSGLETVFLIRISYCYADEEEPVLIVACHPELNRPPDTRWAD
jgi:hypothetical protein